MVHAKSFEGLLFCSTSARSYHQHHHRSKPWPSYEWTDLYFSDTLNYRRKWCNTVIGCRLVPHNRSVLNAWISSLSTLPLRTPFQVDCLVRWIGCGWCLHNIVTVTIMARMPCTSWYYFYLLYFYKLQIVNYFHIAQYHLVHLQDIRVSPKFQWNAYR